MLDRIEWAIRIGRYDPKNNYDSKWIYYKHLKFIDTGRKPKDYYSSKRINLGNNESDDDDMEILIEIHDNISDNIETSSNNAKNQYYGSDILRNCENNPENQDKSYSNDNVSPKSLDISIDLNMSFKEPDRLLTSSVDIKNEIKDESCSNENDLFTKYAQCSNIDSDSNEFLNCPLPDTIRQKSEKTPIVEQMHIRNKESDLRTSVKKGEQIPTSKCANRKEILNKSCPNTNNFSAQFHNMDPGNEGFLDSSLHDNLRVIPKNTTNQEISLNNLEKETVEIQTSTEIIKKEIEVESYTNRNAFTLHNTQFQNIKKESADNKQISDIHNCAGIYSEASKEIDISPNKRYSQENFANSAPTKTSRDSIQNHSIISNAKNIKFPTAYNAHDFDLNFLISFLPHMKSMSQIQNLNFRVKLSELILVILKNREISDSESANTFDKQNTLLKDIGNTEDPDCYFLLSFLSHIKSLSSVENLQFRVKMSDLMLNIISKV